MATCPACRREVPEAATVECPLCGVIFAKWRGHGLPPPAQPKPKAKSAALKPCPACQRDLAGVRIMDERCSYCGKTLPDGFDSKPELPQAAGSTSVVRPAKPSVPISAILLSVVVMSIGRYVYQKFDEYTIKQKTTQHVEELLAKGPEAAQQEASERLASASAQNKPKVAASNFYGYYLLHTRGYYNYCQQRYGIDIAPYATAFSDAHKVEYEKAKLILSQAGFGFTEEKAWSMLKSGVERAVAHDMSETEKTSGASQAALCQALSANAQAIVTQVHFSKVNADAHNVLLAAAIVAR